MRLLSTLLFLLTALRAAWAQPTPQAGTAATDRPVDIVYSDYLEVDGEVKRLTGSTRANNFRQDSVDFFCWRGTMLPDNFMTAAGDVQIVQPDSVVVFSDSLFYNGDERAASLFGDVVLTDQEATLFTGRMDYDLDTEIAVYPDGALIVKDSAQLTSRKGEYHVRSNMAYFREAVKIVHPDFVLLADTLSYNTSSETAFFQGPTDIRQDGRWIYCEAGYYRTRDKFAVFEKNARFADPEKQQLAQGDRIVYDGQKGLYRLEGNAYFEDSTKAVHADTILYDENRKQYDFRGKPRFADRNSPQAVTADFSTYDEAANTMRFRRNVVVEDSTKTLYADSLDYNRTTRLGQARGHVVWRDSAENSSLICGALDYNDSTGYLLAYRRPELVFLIDSDSLWLWADTLRSELDSAGAETRTLYGYRHVQVYKSDLQAISDSLVFRSRDSVFTFFQDPVLWADTSQFTADTLTVGLKNKKIDFVQLFHRAFIVNRPDSLYHNQIKGDDIHVRFSDGEARTMRVFREGEAVYYVQDNSKAFSGVNKTVCEDMLVLFGKNKVEQIRFYQNPKAVLYPMGQVNHRSLLLEGFRWIRSPGRRK
jgi:lipopolysaccharide export system protein LptA